MCAICGKRPAVEGSAFCHNCLQKVESERRSRRKPEPRHFLTYQGHVVGLYPDGQGKLNAQLLRRNPDNLPKSKTVNLDRYCEGFSRETIKAFKRCVLQLAFPNVH
jgi:hypothetical protein